MASPADTITPESGTGPYGLEQPTLAEALAALQRLYGPHTPNIWQSLLARTGLDGTESDPVSFDRLVNCMNTAEPITRLCGRSLGIRAAAHRRLAAAHA